MKLFFTKDDSLYKIIKSLEKLPAGKHVYIHIDRQNNFFAHAWWGKQMVSLLQEKGVPFTCISQHPSTKKYFQNNHIKHEYVAGNPILQGLNTIGDFLFNIKKFHLSVFTKKTSLSYILIAGEIVGICIILYIMYQFLIPSTTVILQPAYNVEDVVYNFRYYPSGTTGHISQSGEDQNFITIPYEYGVIEHTQSLSVPVGSLQYLSRPSAGNILVTNTLNTSFKLKNGTRFVTSDGRVFLTNDALTLPGGTRANPSQVVVGVKAADKDLSGGVMGERGNITTGEKLLIKNLSQSNILGAIYAFPTTSFSGGMTKKSGSVTQEDIDMVENKLLQQYTGVNALVLVKKLFKSEDGFLLPLADKIYAQKRGFTTNASSGNVVDNLEGNITMAISYPYIIWNNLLDGVMKYVSQRPSQSKQLISIQKNTLTFYDTYVVGNYVVVPTRVSAVWGYDFEKDVNNITEEIRQKIAGMSVDEARKVVLSYPEISSVLIKNSPAWTDVLPTLKSRIFFKTTSKGGQE